MDKIRTYLTEVLARDPGKIERVPKEDQKPLPLYIRHGYQLYRASIVHQPVILAKLGVENDFTGTQIENHLDMIYHIMGAKVALVMLDITAIQRRRLIDKGINFIVPGKQLFMPEMMLDLRETFSDRRSKRSMEKLLPSAQFILLYYLLHTGKKEKIEGKSLKMLAEQFDYTQMGITKAVENLRVTGLCEVQGTKEKYIRFLQEGFALWREAKDRLVDPVLKRVFVDDLPFQAHLKSNASALPNFSDINANQQQYYAIHKKSYYELQKEGKLVNENDEEGRYCLEVFKYDPIRLIEGSVTEKEDTVDPLSLYLSMKEMQDERTEMALEQLINKVAW